MNRCYLICSVYLGVNSIELSEGYPDLIMVIHAALGLQRENDLKIKVPYHPPSNKISWAT